MRAVHRAPDAILSTPAIEADPTDPQILQACADLVATMRAHAGCVGVAAPQIGLGIRAFCLDVTGHRKAKSSHGLVVLMNPRLVDAHDPVLAREGCLSVPDLTGDVRRPAFVVVRGQVPGTGSELEFRADAFEARAFSHELDHLDGLLFLDRVASAHAIYARRNYL